QVGVSSRTRLRNEAAPVGKLAFAQTTISISIRPNCASASPSLDARNTDASGSAAVMRSRQRSSRVTRRRVIMCGAMRLIAETLGTTEDSSEIGEFLKGHGGHCSPLISRAVWLAERRVAVIGRRI